MLFADDTTISIIGKDLESAVKKANDSLGNIHSWFEANKLCLNNSKSVWIHFWKSMKPSKSQLTHKIFIGSDALQQVTKAKFLGILVDDNLKWRSQIDKVASQPASFTGVLAKLRQTVRRQVFLTLYNIFVQPQLQFGLQVWGQGDLKKVTSAQNGIVRTIAWVSGKAHIEPLYHRFKVMNITDLVCHELRKIGFQAASSLLPLHVNKSLPPQS
jgi:hypothetical protein